MISKHKKVIDKMDRSIKLTYDNEKKTSQLDENHS